MLSAQKTKSIDEIVNFIGGRRAVLSFKLDGLTLVLRYENGRLTQALTRGGEGGMIGEDVTHTVRAMVNVPLTIPCTDSFEVRGEGVISWENFDRLNNSSGETYAHPRSVAAGGVRRLDVCKTKAQFLEFFAFELISGNIKTKTEQLDKLAENGFSVVRNHIVCEGAAADQIRAAINDFQPKMFAYPVDGVIVEYDDLAYGQSLGATGHHENRLIALKWDDELFETTFLRLEPATTRTGMVSLTAVLEDVVIDGTNVNRAYMHNLIFLDNLSLGTGDRVQVYKANQIIPQIAENLTRSGTLEYPKECPCCGFALVTRTSESGTRMLFCENPNCSAILVRKFAHFCDKTRMNLEGFSEKTLTRLIDAKLIKNLGDLYLLERRFVEIARMPGFGPTSVQKMLRVIDESRQRTLAQFIAGLGIPLVGRTAGRLLDAHFDGSWIKFEQAIKDGFDFAQLQDFGETMHNSIYAWYADTEEDKFWRPLLQHITFIKEEKENNPMNPNNPFNGKTVVVTGKLLNYSRDDIHSKLLSLGAKFGTSISKNTDFLIAAAEKTGGKLDKARQLGVQILSESEFEALLEA
jgi:DNA ligase (NAD+)